MSFHHKKTSFNCGPFKSTRVGIYLVVYLTCKFTYAMLYNIVSLQWPILNTKMTPVSFFPGALLKLGLSAWSVSREFVAGANKRSSNCLLLLDRANLLLNGTSASVQASHVGILAKLDSSTRTQYVQQSVVNCNAMV